MLIRALLIAVISLATACERDAQRQSATAPREAPAAPVAAAPPPAPPETAPAPPAASVDARPAPAEAATEPGPPPARAPEPTGAPPPASEKLANGARCREGTQCASGICEGAGCRGICVSRQRGCTRDSRTYCGCDGNDFRASGSCPGRPYQHKGSCGDEPGDEPLPE